MLAAWAEAAAAGEADGMLDLLWRSRRARWAWLVLVAALTAGNLVVSQVAGDARPGRASWVDRPAAQAAAGLRGWWRSWAWERGWIEIEPPPKDVWADVGPALRRSPIEEE